MKRFRKHSSARNELALIKAAAWAWYEHGTGLEGKSLREFDIRRSFHDPKPSRFKLQAKKLAEQGSKDMDDGLSDLSPGTSSGRAETVDDHSLLDRYEIESISRRFDQLMESSGDKGRPSSKGFLVGVRLAQQHNHKHPEPTSSSEWSPPRRLQAPTSASGELRRKGSLESSDGDYTTRRMKKKSSNSNLRGFWQRQAVICGSSAHKDVVLGTRSFVDSQGQRQFPHKRKV
ncbi:uncharacterized protein LOC126803753 [Argentina anserina]|uniref:uncharacterized protein LOC126803753 n=1 Tax=Argentina anserina TaxID=57926 RepID=UPI002176499B|nr:uncharacterized protein LOC126803753 [Potentilla anserina]